VARWAPGMLLVMQEPAAPAPSSASPTFAGLLAALASPAKRPVTAWSDDALEDDVATLSYEHALRAHARYRPTNLTDESLLQVSDPCPARNGETPPAPAASREVCSEANTPPEAMRPAHRGFERNLKCSSITIRMSDAECAQLRRRASDAGLTVSAYLRSCTFEAESLRALVKDTLAQLRAATPLAAPARPVKTRRFRFGWLARLLPRWRGAESIARA